MVGEYGLAVFSETLTVSCLANARLGTGANDVQHPNWVEPNRNCPTCDSYHASPNCSVFLTGRTAGAVTVEVLIRV